jgi:hypothetical protein
MDPGSAPQRVLKTHSPDQITQLFADPRPPSERARPPSPKSGKTRSMPTHDRLRSDNCYGIKNARPATIEPDEQSAVDPAQMRSEGRALPQDIELMPQDQDFGFQPRSRLEAVPHHTDQQQGNCDHQPRSCSDSVSVVTPVDKVFGSDRLLCTCQRWVERPRAGYNPTLIIANDRLRSIATSSTTTKLSVASPVMGSPLRKAGSECS